MSVKQGLTFLKEIQRNYDKQRKIKIDASKTQYPLIRNVAANQIGWTLWGKQDQKGDANIFWVDTYITEQTIKRLNPYQKINHFPNSQQLCKKSNLSENLHKLKAVLPEEYNFYPQTWMIPEQIDKMKEQNNNQQKKWYIVKPASSSQGKGIYLTKQITKIPKQNAIVQQYITNPCLIDQCKFDLRLYVLIKSLTPLKIFRYVEGLTRISINSYQKPSKSNRNNLMIHLTNYAINKVHPSYVQNKSISEDWVGHKRSLTAVFEYLQQLGCDKIKLLSQIDDIIVKTILAAYPKMQQSYKNCRNWQVQTESVCFQVLGFDILIDNTFKPWLLEVNHSPSFCTDSPLDYIIKKSLVLDTFVLMNLNCQDKQLFLKNRSKQAHQRQKYQRDLIKQRKIQNQQHQKSHTGGYIQIYPLKDISVYSDILKKLKDKTKKKKINKFFIATEKYDLNETADSSIKFINKKSKEMLDFCNRFTIRRIKQSSMGDYESAKQEEALRRHLFSQRDKKRIEPIKLNNVNISFKQQNGNKSLCLNHTTNQQNPFNLNQKHTHSLNRTFNAISPSKTSQGIRNDIKIFDKDLHSRISKIKMARIRLQKIKSNDRHHRNPSIISHSQKNKGQTYKKQTVFLSPSNEQYSPTYI